MPSLEDHVYDSLVARINAATNAMLISGHPPSGKAYSTELVRIPARDRNAGRYHVDIILIADHRLVLIELKGLLSQSADDVEKLRTIQAEYTCDELIALISRRVNLAEINWSTITDVIPAVGVASMDATLPEDTSVICASREGNVTIHVPSTAEDPGAIEEILNSVFVQ